MRTKLSIVACSALLFVATHMFGQAVTSIRGHVTDPSGAAVPGAQIKLVRPDSNLSRDAVTSNEGSYEFLQLAPGNYVLRVAASGFAPTERTDLTLLVNVAATVDVRLEVAGSTQTVAVTEMAAPMVNTADATLGNAFDNKQVEQLPIEARNVVELLSLQPGVVYLGNRVNQNSDTRSGAVNGARSDQSNVTLDGVDVNDQNKAYAFTSVLRNTQDSVEEFRVTTSNANADAGRSSGAQVSLVTKGGTNTFHGSAYEYNRNTLFSANDYFLKSAELASGLPNERSKLIRNVYGTSVGGPIKKDRLFFFLNYEGRRDRQAASESRTVPSDSFRQGLLIYQNQAGGQSTLTPAQIKAMDPLGVGESSAILTLLQSYPRANEPGGDGLNTGGFRFAANEAGKFDTYIAKIDYNITSNGRNTVFWRGNLQNDNQGGAPQFPGQPPATKTLDNSKGFGAGYTAVLAPNKVNSFRWGFTRQGGEIAGALFSSHVGLPGVDSPIATSRSNKYLVPVNNLTDDFSWTRGSHTLEFGTNLRFISNNRISYDNAFSSASINLGWLFDSGISNKGVPFDPAVAGFPAVASSFSKSYDNAVMNLVGMVTEGDAVYNYDKTGKALALGSPVRRDYRWNEYEFYGQDSWKIRPNLTLTYGLRWTLLEPPYEVHGTQVGPCTLNGTACDPLSLTDWYNTSAQQGKMGGSASVAPQISFAPNGKANGQPGFWKWDLGNFAPRVALAWAPDFGGGWLSKIFGPKGKTSIRGGYAIFYDHFGAATVNSYDAAGSYGLTSQVSNVPGSVHVDTAPRFISVTDIPPGLLPPAAPGGFPATPSPSAFAISWGMDRAMKTPFAHGIDFSISRELTQSFSLDLAYVGRFSRRLPEQVDVAMPLDLVDPKSKMDYFTAATMLSKLAYAGVPIQNVRPIPYWENMFGALDGTVIGGRTLTATQVAYSTFQPNVGNETYALTLLDQPDSQSGAGLNVPGHSYPSYRFYHDQYSALYAWRTIGKASYNGLQVTLHKRFSQGLQGDFNYTWSKSFDWTSQAERIPSSGGINGAQIYNSWKPDQLRGVSDFDTTHQINANWIFEVPAGRGRRFASQIHPVLNAVIGGWQLNGLFRWTSGFPFSIGNGAQWPTNWDIEGYAMFQGPLAKSALNHVKGPQAFQDQQAVFQAFRADYPGETGTRNPLRGDGYFGVDAGLSKVFSVVERVKLRLRWDVFNVTNSVRFDVYSMHHRIDAASSFGLYTQTLTQPRVMQVAMRVEF